MRKLCLFVIGPVTALIVVAWLFLFPASAVAAGLVRPLPGPLILGFNSAYRPADGQTRYHTGVDISGEAGARVGSAGEGQVTFCGRVPGPAGSSVRVLAVTVQLDDGRLATYLPLVQASVSKGDSVAQGDSIGTLAGTGDMSSPGPHLHLGVRENGTYVDPSPLPIAAPPAPTPRPAPQPEGFPTPQPSPLPVPTSHPPVASRHPAAPSAGATQQGSLPAGDHAAEPAVSALTAGPARGSHLERPRVGSAEQDAYRSRFLRANRLQPQCFPAGTTFGAGQTADGEACGSQFKLPSVRLHPGWLMAISGVMFAAASVLGTWKRRLGFNHPSIHVGPVAAVQPAMAQQASVGVTRHD